MAGAPTQVQDDQINKKRKSKNDIEGRDHNCKYCENKYLSYCALYNHITQKHPKGPDGESRKPPTCRKGRFFDQEDARVDFAKGSIKEQDSALCGRGFCQQSTIRGDKNFVTEGAPSQNQDSENQKYTPLMNIESMEHQEDWIYIEHNQKDKVYSSLD